MDTFKPDDPWPPNSSFNRLLRAARRGRLASVGPGLELRSGGLSRVRSARIWAKLSGSGPAYGLAEATPNASGGFDLVAGGRTDDGGQQPAYELNGVGGLAGTYQRLRSSTAGDWRFQERTTGAGSGGPPTTTVPLPYCFCSPVPATLTMTSADPSCNYGMFQSCTIQYGPTRPAFANLNMGPYSFVSTRGFPDPIAGGALFYYYFTCQYNQFSLSRVYETSSYGSPYRDGVLYTWILGGSDNTCVPFNLALGRAFPGSNASCSVTING